MVVSGDDGAEGMQIDLLAHRVNGTHGETLQSDGYEGKHFRLAADITYDHTGLGDTESNYEAIGGNIDGTNNRYFRGTFDGQNHVVIGIRIYKDGTANADRYQGLFGRISSPAEVKSVILADARITGDNHTGAIVGYNGGTITDCHALADVTVHAVWNYASYHGGIVGYNFGTGTYAPVSIPEDGVNTKLYLGAYNMLYYPNAAMTIGSQRAYFQLAEGQSEGIVYFVLNFGDDMPNSGYDDMPNSGYDEATGIITTNSSNSSNEWYTLDGRKFDKQPTASGVYIHQGKKVVVK